MHQKPYVSIIVTCFNVEKTIEETLSSIEQQTYNNWECIIVDDKSTDNTVSLVEQYILGKSKFRIVRNINNLGNPKSLNIGIKESTYDYIMFVDGDDLISSDCLENRSVYLLNDYDFVVFPNFQRFAVRLGDLKIVQNEIKFSNNPLKDFIIHKLPTPWNIMSPVWKREALYRIGLFNEKYVRIVDVELSTRALIYGLNYSVVNHKADHFYRVTNNDLTIKNKRRRFFLASMTFIDEIKAFTMYNKNNKIQVVEKYLYLFFLSVLSMTLISKEFEKEDGLNLIRCARNNGIIHSKMWELMVNCNLIQNISKLPVFRTIIWRGVSFYINI